MAGQIDCPAPLPEGPADALLTEMLTLASLKGAGEDQEGQGNPKEFPAPGDIRLIVQGLLSALLPRRRGGR